MKAFKGFDLNWKCRDQQFTVGGEFKHDGPVELCSSGFHVVENPLDAFHYYAPGQSRYAEVEAEGVSEQKHDEDSKRVCRSLKIVAELSLHALCGLGSKFILDKVDWDNAKESNTGDRSAATNTGDQSAATNTGDQGCAISLGIEGRASGAIGCWLTLAEWKYDEKKSGWHRIDVQTVRVDGVTVKANTFYQLVDGKFAAVEQGGAQ